MKQLLLLILLFSFSTGFSQIWVKPNAVWHYDYSVMGWPGLMKIEHVGDTSIQGKSCMHFSATDYQFMFNQQNQFVSYSAYPAGEFYTFTEGDTVFYLQNDTFQKLFDFSKSTGDSYKIGVTNPDPLDQCNSESWTMVTGVGIDVFAYPSITVEAYLDANLKLNGTFNKRFGGDYFFPLERSCDPNIVYEDYVFSFRCFQDDSLVVNPSGVECEYMLTHVGTPELDQHSIVIFPNPADERLFIQSEQGLVSVAVEDLNGRVINDSSLLFEEGIDISNLSSGIYLVRIETKDGRNLTRSFRKK